MRAAGLWIGLLLWPGAGLALSCLPPDVTSTFEMAEKAAEKHVIVLGKLDFDEAAQPDPDLPQTEAETTFLPARLEGHGLTLSGFDAEFSQDITLELACFGPWCGRAVAGVRYLAFLRRDVAGYTMVIDPCGNWAFPDPTDAQLLQAQTCLRDGCPLVDQQ